jgi:hypothetical protein
VRVTSLAAAGHIEGIRKQPGGGTNLSHNRWRYAGAHRYSDRRIAEPAARRPAATAVCPGRMRSLFSDLCQRFSFPFDCGWLRRGSHVRHAGDPDELPELPCHELRSIVGDDRFVTLTACGKAEEPRPKAKRPARRYRPPAGQSRWMDRFSLKRNAGWGNYPPQPAVVSAALRAPLARLKNDGKQELSTLLVSGTFYFALTAGKAQSAASTNRDKILSRWQPMEVTSK